MKKLILLILIMMFATVISTSIYAVAETVSYTQHTMPYSYNESEDLGSGGNKSTHIIEKDGVTRYLKTRVRVKNSGKSMYVKLKTKGVNEVGYEESIKTQTSTWLDKSITVGHYVPIGYLEYSYHKAQGAGNTATWQYEME